MAKILKKEGNVITIEYTILPEELEKEKNNVYLKNRGKYKIDGFRNGKAPRILIEKKYGPVFSEKALENVVTEKYENSLAELQISPIDRPEIDLDKLQENEEIKVIADVQVLPEVTLPEISDVEIEKIEISVSDEDVQNEIKAMQEKNARIISVEGRAVQEGDILTIDYKGFIGEEQFEGGTAENHSLEIGSNQFIEGFESHYIGKSEGDEKEVNVTFPENYHSDKLAGKDAKFIVKIHEIKSKELPELDDEFAKDISEFDTMDELIKSTKENMTQRAEDSRKVQEQNAAITAFVEKSETIVPEIMIENEIEYQIKRFEEQMVSQGINPDDYYRMIGSDIEKMKEGIRPQAEVSAKTELVLNALIEKENFEVSQDELNQELEKMAESYKIEDESRIEDFKKLLLERSGEYIHNMIKRRKAIDFITEKVKQK